MMTAVEGLMRIGSRILYPSWTLDLCNVENVLAEAFARKNLGKTARGMREATMQRCSRPRGGAHVSHALLRERELALHNHLQTAVRHHARQLILHAVEVKSRGSHVRMLGAAQKCDEQSNSRINVVGPKPECLCCW
jgi:hypothetical protein